ncbi:two-partner secretion domain-containing protein, partial [Variovorax fucosicus]|uniref:two-partner secretion domain-containing protein n=1 Tax=Variovorax fucosicus TaxID=3053517 RepID=UPI00257602C8
MNKHLHRIVFNAARGMRMVVQETAMSAGKASGATPAIAAAALTAVLLATPGHAQIAGALNVPNTQRPTVLVAPNGVPLVNIQTPSAAGVSRNVFSQFDVMANGVILNNSRTNVSTQLGGWVQGNPWLANGPARIILNEINSGNPTQLRGYVEVGGQRAEVIIANPAGISVDGGGFINASRATLTTGTPQFGALGSLDSFLVRGGTVTIDGAGLDASTTDYAAILARAVNVNAAIYATDLKVVTGANQVSADHSQITPTAGTGAAPTFALDVSRLGGMYAGKIVLVGSEAGLGVRNAGSIGASAGNLVVTAAGRLENTGTLEGQSVQLSSATDIDNRGGTIRQTSTAALTIAAPTLSNTAGGWIGSEPVAASTGSSTGTTGSTGTTSGSTGATSGTTTSGSTTTGAGATSTGTGTVAASTPPAPGAITAGSALLNDGGKIYAGGPITLQSANLVNNGGTLSVASMTLNQPSFSNAGGTLNVSGAFSANVDHFDNSAGTLHAGNLQISTTGDLINVDGTLTSDADASLAVGGKLDNTRGTVSSVGATTAQVTGAIQNTDGRIASGANLTIQAGSVTGSKGALQSTGDLAVTAAQGLTSTGTNIASGNASLQGAFVDLSGSQTGGTNIAITATQGDVATSGATVATPGTLAITANSQSGQTLVNSAGTLNAGQLQINASNIANTNGGEIVQTGTGTTTLTIGGTLNNNAGTIASAGDIAVSAGSLSNQGGKLQAAGTSSLSLSVANQLDNSAAGQILAGGNSTLSAGSLVNDSGTITAVGDLAATVTGAASNQGGTLAANGNTTVAAASFNNNGGTAAAVNGNLNVTTTGATTNAGGTLQAGGATTLSNAGLDNTGGKVFGDSVSVDTHSQQLTNALGTLAATQTVNLQTGTIANDAGLIQSGGAMVIDTHGQGLRNTNAAGYAGGQGGIASGDTLTLNAGGVNNAGGFIGAKGAVVANTQGLSNTGGGQIVGESSVNLNANGNTFDNSGGQVQAVGALTVAAAGINNTGGLLRSTATTTLNAATIVNASTQGTDQGIEGDNVEITAVDLNNNTGAIRANTDVTVSASGLADNTNGLMSAGGTLALKDPNAANPGAKTLSVVNTGGTLIANKSVQIDASRFSGDGSLQSGMDLSIALTQDIVNNAEVIANGNLSYGTTGNFTNNGKLIAGDTLTVSGNVVENTVNAEMSGTDTVVNAGTLNNRGLIDSYGKTQINTGAAGGPSGSVNNVGTGRIYGNDISVATGTLNNDTETIGGVTRAGTIAARSTLNIGAGTINNREHALLFSGNTMAIGGALDANRLATGQGSVLNNLSASIESLGDMSISMAQVNNWDTHLQVGPPTTTTSNLVQIAPVGAGFYDLNDVIYTPGSPYVFQRNPDGSQGALLSSNGYGIWNTTYQVTQDTAINADPARIVAGGDLTINGNLYNKNSRVVAGGTLSATSVNNEALQGSRVTTGSTFVVDYKGGTYIVSTPTTTQTVPIGAFEYTPNTQGTSGYNSGTAPTGTASASGGTAGASGGTRNATIVEVAANVGSVAGAAGGTGQSVPMVVRTSTPNLGIPQASLFRTTGGGHYLIETDPRFAGYRPWLSSDYLLNHLGLDPNSTLKRLGDGFYEQQLIREQIAQLTGYRYLDGYTSDDAQYTALMNAGVTFAQQYGLRPGVALTAAQMAQLTSDIVWLVEQTVTLPDGSTQRVLVPQVYVRVQPGDIDGSGALLSGNEVKIDGKNSNFTNTGTVAGRQVVSINANTIDNLGGRIAGASVGLKAQLDINNIGGTIAARDKLTLDAGRDINVRTTTQTNMGVASGTNIDRVAGLYVTNPGGTLVASAGHDVNLVGAVIANAGTGKTSITAKNDINLGTVTEAGSSTSLGVNANFQGGYSWSKEIGTQISGGGNVALDAGNDVSARASTVSAGGDLSVRAGNDITIESGRETSDFGFTATWGTKGIVTRTTNTVSGEAHTNTAIASTFSGNNLAMDAGRDINIV